MREDGPSQTAMGVAIFRAAHQLFDTPAVFVDPFAVRIVGPEARADLETRPRRRWWRRRLSHLRAVAVVRSRIAEDALALAVSRGVRQYVVLGAGLDTFALRNTDLSLRVFEVDHPNTQQWKRRRLEEEHLGEPPNLTFVPIDFERQDLEAELRAAGLAWDRPTFFSWLGVTPYLGADAVWATLRSVAGAAGREGGIVFDFVARPRRTQLRLRLRLWRRRRQVAGLGEPFRAVLDPEEVARNLHGLGFTEVATLGRDEINRRYLAGRADGLRVRGLTQIAVARGAEARTP
jgi:methyltransferase (TIGR00027 family)